MKRTLLFLALTTAVLFITTNLAANTAFDQSPGVAVIKIDKVDSTMASQANDVGNELNTAATVSPGVANKAIDSYLNPSVATVSPGVANANSAGGIRLKKPIQRAANGAINPAGVNATKT